MSCRLGRSKFLRWIGRKGNTSIFKRLIHLFIKKYHDISACQKHPGNRRVVVIPRRHRAQGAPHRDESMGRGDGVIGLQLPRLPACHPPVRCMHLCVAVRRRPGNRVCPQVLRPLPHFHCGNHQHGRQFSITNDHVRSHARAGPEFGLCSTKMYTSLFITFTMLATYLGSNNIEMMQRNQQVRLLSPIFNGNDMAGNN